MDRQAAQVVQLVARPVGAHRHEALVAAVFRRQHRVGFFLGAQAPQQRVWFEASAVAGGAGRVAAVLRQQHAHVHLASLPPFQSGVP
ncbi:hypothetical protein G6F50_018101 [Rhizopus delemar]|uniref:Uncharacterized protein n=1 Tax=Rhizopus delemar TaxID=936053 RepID=A0A9P7BZA0_9FUNG|nr:hypothetical protein G6F50_018101 [Rhizopus delemar]